MGGALLVTAPAFRPILNRPRPVLADAFALPTRSAVDARLLGGAAPLFGVGWGLSGFCPGPAVAALSTGLTPVLAFVGSMLAGMTVYAESLIVRQRSALLREHMSSMGARKVAPRAHRKKAAPRCRGHERLAFSDGRERGLRASFRVSGSWEVNLSANRSGLFSKGNPRR